jgi:tetratricopeptide (TPR) repeat protein
VSTGEKAGSESNSYPGAFVGRRRELAELVSAVRAGQSERPHCLFLISGEPGIGKTRLAHELAIQAASKSVRVMWGKCWERGAPAYWPWVQIIRTLLKSGAGNLPLSELIPREFTQISPELISAPGRNDPSTLAQRDSEFSRFRLFDAVANLLTSSARASPILLILDDLHDGDLASLDLLRFAAREARNAPITMVGTYREAEVRRSPELGKLVGELSREAIALPLKGLSEAEVASLVESIAGRSFDRELVGRMRAETDGNPLFVEGIVRLMIADASGDGAGSRDSSFPIPEGIREAIRLRLASLSEKTRSILEIAAVIGNEFEATRLQWLSAALPEASQASLDEAVVCGIIVRQGFGSYRFAHALIREVLYDDLDTATKLRFHRTIGEAIEELHRADLQSHVAELAHHFRQSGIADKAADYSIRAAEAAEAAFAYEDAVAHLEDALTVGNSIDSLTRGVILQRLGFLRWIFFESGQGIEDMEDALAIFETLRNSHLIFESRVSLGLALAAFGPHSNVFHALAHLQAAESTTKEDPQLVALMFFALSLANENRFRNARALHANRRATEIYTDMGLSEHSKWVHMTKDLTRLLTSRGRLGEANAHANLVVSAASRLADHDAYGWAVYVAAECRLWMGDPRGAIRYLELGLGKNGLARRGRWVLERTLASARLELGDIALAEEAITGPDRYHVSARSQIALLKGDLKAARGILEEHLDWARLTGCGMQEFRTTCSLAHLLLVAGDLDEATTRVRQLEGFYEAGDVYWELLHRTLAVTLAFEANRAADARPHLERCRAILASGEDWLGLAGDVALAEGMLSAMDGRLNDAEEHLAKALEIFTRFERVWEQAETLRVHGRVYLGQDEPLRAFETFDRAIQIYRRCGAGQLWIDRVEEARAAPLIAPTTRRERAENTRRAPDGIFRKEGEFWTLCYEGRTNRLKDAKGMHYIAHLLAHPGIRIHVFELANAGERPSGVLGDFIERRLNGVEVVHDLSDAGPALDARAGAEYRRRMKDLQFELSEAEAFNDRGRCEKISTEIEFIRTELSAAIGIGDRDRRSRSVAERQRQTVTKSIRATIESIRRNDPLLGRHLATSIKTGLSCVYFADPDRKIHWQAWPLP